MSLIFLVIGTILFLTGRLAFGNFRAEGKHVKGAGLILMMPALGAFFISLFVGMLFGSSAELLISLLNLLIVLEFAGLIIAGIIAYRMIANPAPSLPNQYRESEAKAQPDVRTLMPAPALVVKPNKTILTLEEAAAYVNMTPAQILSLIDEGKLAAARVNYRYQIARSALDELLEAREMA